MNPGSDVCIDYAYVFARSGSGGSIASLDSLRLASDHVREFYNSNSELNQCECQAQAISSVTEYNIFDNVSLFPNPATEKLNLQFDAIRAAHTEVIITDYLGRDVSSIPVKISRGRNSFMLPISNLSNGVYTLRLASETIFTTMKFVKY